MLNSCIQMLQFVITKFNKYIAEERNGFLDLLSLLTRILLRQFLADLLQMQ